MSNISISSGARPTSRPQWLRSQLIIQYVSLIVLLAFSPPRFGSVCLAQSSDAEPMTAERATAERYLKVLLRRPRPGVALDRVYGFHVQNDSLEALQDTLKADLPDEPAGAGSLIWGLIELQRGNTAEAVIELQAAEELRAEDAVCSFYLGRALLSLGKTELALEAMERAIDRGPRRSDALPIFTELGRLYSRAGQSEKSLRVWQRLEAMFPGDRKVGGRIAKALAEEGEYEKAKLRYQSLAQQSRNPSDRIAFEVQAAEMDRESGESELALKQFEAILERLRPGSWLHSDVRTRIESGFLATADYDGLVTYYEGRLKQNPDDISLRSRLAQLLSTSGRLNEAKEMLESSIRLAPEGSSLRLALVDVLVAQSNIAEASKQFERLTEIEPGNPDYFMRWGSVLLRDGQASEEKRVDNAAKVWLRLADDRKNDPVMLSEIADRLRAVDRQDDAIRLYQESISLDPDSPQYREYLGEYLYALDRKEEAIETWQSLAEGRRRNRETLVRLAEVLDMFEQTELALQAWDEASELDLDFNQELRYAEKLVEASRYDQAIERLDLAAPMAETPEEQTQLLGSRIQVYKASGGLKQQIAELVNQTLTIDGLKTLAVMQSADGDLLAAERSINKARAEDPDDLALISIAADLAEKQSRFVDAVQLFQRLADAEVRYRSNYLQRIARLHVRMGEADDAISTCQKIIDNNPASTDPYQFYARTAFDLGRDEAAISVLRQAIAVAPRDNSPKDMLAQHFANVFRTEEAIELHWQAFSYESSLNAKIDRMRMLGPLYERKGDFDTLIERIEETNQREQDERAAAFMVAGAHESVQDYGATRAALEPLLAKSPRDLELLQRMVQLCDAADDLEQATDYQRRIVDLATTPENQFRLMQLQLETGELSYDEVFNERIAFVSDVQRLGGMIRSACRRGDLEDAISICRLTLRRDDSLWDVKLILAQLLLHQASGSERERLEKEALQYLVEVNNLAIAVDQKPPTKGTAKKPVNAAPRTPSQSLSPRTWSNSNYQIARLLQTGTSNPFGSSTSGFQLIESFSYGNAKVIARSLQLLVVSGRPESKKAAEIVARSMDVELEKLIQANQQDANEYWELYAITSLIDRLEANLPQTANQLSETKRKQAELTQLLLWRLTDLDPENATELLLQRLTARLYSGANGQADVDLTPFADNDLERLNRIRNRIANGELVLAQPFTGYYPGYSNHQIKAQQAIKLNALLANEYRLAGMPEKADRIQLVDPKADLSYEELRAAMDYHVRLEEFEKAKAVLDTLIDEARRGTPPQWISSNTIRIAPKGEFYTENHLALLDAEIARWAFSKSKTRTPPGLIGVGQLGIYIRVPTPQRYKNITVNAPLSSRLLDSKLAHLAMRDVDQANSGSTSPLGRRPSPVQISDDVISHLEKELPGALEEEQKTRRILAAFCHWWCDRPEDCFRILNRLSEQFPGDIELQLETARVASEVSRPKLALEKLDQFEPLDSKMRVRKEMAALNLATQVGNAKRGKEAVQRLLGMRMDVSTQLALVGNLEMLGLREEANQILRRTRRGRQKDEQTEIQIAEAFLAAGDNEAAGEVAASLLRRLSTGRTSRNAASYRSSVTRLLRQTGRLDDLIEQAERRVKSNPTSLRAKQKLSELYTAAGRQSDANELLGALAEEDVNGVPQMRVRARLLSATSNKSSALKLYLDVYEKDLSRFSYSDLSKLVQSNTSLADELFERLDKFPIESLPLSRATEIVRLGRRNTSDAFKRVLGRIIKTHGAVQITSLTSGVDAAMLRSLPEYRQAMRDVLANRENYRTTATVWQSRRYGTDGTLIGKLEDILQTLKESPESLKQVRETANAMTSVEATRATAEFMLGLLNVTFNTDQETGLQQMIEVIQLEKGSRSPVPVGLIWQAGQVLEKDPAVPRSSIIKLYEPICVTGSTQNIFSSSPQSRLETRLINLYAQEMQFDKAIDMLLAIRTNQSRSTVSSPGYTEYQNLQSDYWVCDKLVDVGGAFEAWVILQTTLADRSVFEKAIRWSRSSLEPKFESLVKKAAEKMDSDLAVRYLERQFDRWETDLQQFPIDLMELGSRSLVSDEDVSSIGFAIQLIHEAPGGIDRLRKLLSRAQKLIEKDSDAMEPYGLALLIAAKIPDAKVDLVSIGERLMEQLPDLNALENESPPSTGQARFSRIKDLYPVAVAAKKSSSPEINAVGRQLTGYLSEYAVVTRDVSLSVAAAKLGEDVSERTKEMLDLIRKGLSKGLAPDNAVIEQLLGIAETTASTGDVESACLALQTALELGPPVPKQIATQARNPFSMQPLGRVSSAVSSQRNTNLQTQPALAIQLDQITKQLESALNVDLRSKPNKTVDASEAIYETAYEAYFGKRPTKKELRALAAERLGDPNASVYEDDVGPEQAVAPPSEVDIEKCNPVLDAYLAVVFPKTDSPSIQFYEVPILSPSSSGSSITLIRQQFRDREITVSSVAHAACRLAVICDRVDEVRRRIETVAAAGVRSFECSVMRLHLATAIIESQLKAGSTSASWNELQESLQQLATLLKGRLRSSQTNSTTRWGISYQVISSSTIQNAAKIEAELNEALHVVWPVVNANLLSPEVLANVELRSEIATAAGEVLSRMRSHVNSNSYARSRLSDLGAMIRSVSSPLLPADKDKDAMRAAIEQEIAPLRVTSTDLAQQQSQWRSMMTIFDTWTRQGWIKFIDQSLRRSVLSRPIGTRADIERMEAGLCLAVSQLEETERFDWLMNFCLGNDAKGKVVFLAGRAFYETPPVRFDLRDVTRKAVQFLCPESSDYVVLNTVTMLVDEAIRQGRTKELRERLEAKRERSGDAADITLALLRVSQAQNGAEDVNALVKVLDPTLQAMTKQIMEGPEQNFGKQYFPELEAQLVFRLAATEFPRERLEPLVAKLRSIAIEGNREYLAATINRAAASAELGLAAGASRHGIPDDFIAVDIPRPTRGRFDRLSPIYIERADGVIHGTGGMGFAHLMFQYPLEGDFTITARIKDSDRGDANLSFAGVTYGASGTRQSGFVRGSGDRGEVVVPVPSANADAMNEESLVIENGSVVAKCNGEAFINDQRLHGFPFASVVHEMTNTIEIADLRFAGNPTIPRQVNLLDQQLRGWSDLWSASKVEPLRLPSPVVSGQKATPTEKPSPNVEASPNVQSNTQSSTLANQDLPMGQWCFRDGELRYKQPTNSRDVLSTLHYLRPLLDGESIEFEFWWDEMEYRFNFTVGRSALILTKEGSYWGYFPKRADLASLVSTESSARGKRLKRRFADNIPVSGWNRFVATRRGNQVEIQLNGSPLEPIELRKDELPGIYRKSETSVRVREITLTGDWPETVPKRWME
ncbi:MAG: tetratricopeptide repeat protein [Planctomycetota bacterium]